LSESVIQLSPRDRTYRPDIDGLRAIAVLSVVAYHIWENVFPGGFVGVDIFFVISGYLITQNIIQDLDKGAFSLKDFYRRRVKRIAPAMILVVCVTVVFAQFLLIPEDAERTAESGLWSLLSLANVYFWLFQDTSYFAADSRETPLLHLWSLGVEEQYYIIWPLLLMLFATRFSSIFTLIALATVGLTSYLLGDLLYPTSASFVYYMLPTRAGELLVGAICALAVRNGYQRLFTSSYANLFALLGIAGIFSSFWLLSEHDAFPGFRALLPTVGAALIILSGNRQTPTAVTSVLSTRPLVLIGLISYSAYLWHWPILAFLRYGYGSLSAALSVIAFIGTFLLASLSFRYVEQPARRTKASAMWVFATQLFVPIGIAGFFFLFVMHTDGYALRDTSSGTVTMRPAYSYGYVCQRFEIAEADVSNPDCVLGAGEDGNRVVLWGDSNAAHYIGIVGSFANAANFSFRNVAHADCPPLLEPRPEFSSPKRQHLCANSIRTVSPLIRNAKVVLISAAWSGYESRHKSFMERFVETLIELTNDGKRVVLIGKAPTFPGYDRRCLQKARLYPMVDCSNPPRPAADSIPEINHRLKLIAESFESVSYFDISDYICPEGSCKPYEDDGTPLYFDGEHLSMDGSWRIGSALLNKDGVPPQFRALGDSTY